MAGLVPAIHVLLHSLPQWTWMPGTRPGMTTVGWGEFMNIPAMLKSFCDAVERHNGKAFTDLFT
jgi:hypothetical protein